MKINRKHESDPKQTPPTHTTFLEYIQTTPYLGKQTWNHCEILKIIKKPYCHRRHGATLRHAEAYLTGSSASQPVELWLSCQAEENQPSRKYGLPRFSNSPQGRRLNCWSHNGTSRKGSTDFNSKLYPCSIVLSSCKVSPWMACNLISFSCVKKSPHCCVPAFYYVAMDWKSSFTKNTFPPGRSPWCTNFRHRTHFSWIAMPSPFSRIVVNMESAMLCI